MQEGLRYSEEAGLNRILFLSDNNDIIFLIEDEFKEYEYEFILNRLFKKNINIDNIFPMKGKPGVRKAFNELGTHYKNKPIVYIVDGDFDVILEKDIINNPHFIYLDKYNIESYYVDKEAVINFMIGKLKKREKDVIQQVSYDFWARDTFEKFEILFINYIIAQMQFPQEKNVGIGPHKFLNQDSGKVDKEKVEHYVNDLKSRLSNYDELKENVLKKYSEKLENNPDRLVCGKYVLASLSQYLRKKMSVTFKEDDFRYYLVCQFDINKLAFMKDRIIKILQQEG